MRPYLVRPPKVYRWLYSDAWFRVPTEKKEVYLTFDDGPHPEATPLVLDVLKKHHVQATFFALGKNAIEYPDLIQRITEEGHMVGNHGMNHLSGWLTPTAEYVQDVDDGKKATGSNLFRPAYGRLLPKQYAKLNKENTIVFWDVIAGDFDQNTNAATIISNVLDNVRSGSIIVFHDSQKALVHLKATLNEVILRLAENGYRFKLLQAE